MIIHVIKIAGILMVIVIGSGCAGGSQEGKNAEAIDAIGLYKKDKSDVTRIIDESKK